MAIQGYMENTLGINGDAVRALMAEGISNFNDLIEMTDDEIIAVVRNTRRPGGYMPVAAGAPAVPNRGVKVTTKEETRVRQLGHYCFHMHRIDRLFIEINATLPVLQQLWAIRNIEKEKMKADVPEPDPLTKPDDIRKTLDSLDHYLLNKRGLNGTPLAYLVRTQVVPPYADPLVYGQPTYAQELIRRARHGDYPAYQEDNESLWSVIRRLTTGGFAWGWVSAFARTQDGRAAYLQLKTHYLGNSLQDKIQSDADRVLDNTFYDGKARNFTYETYCTKLNQAFTDLEDCGDKLLESRKVRVFLRGLRAPELMPAKAQVLASDHLRETVATAMNYVKTFENTLDSQKSSSRNVSTYESGGRGRGRGDRGGRGRGGRGGGRGRGSGGKGKSAYDPKKNHYSPQEWRSLTSDEQQKVRDARTAAKSGGKRSVAAVTFLDDEGESSGKRQKNEGTSGMGSSMTRRNEKS